MIGDLQARADGVAKTTRGGGAEESDALRRKEGTVAVRGPGGVRGGTREDIDKKRGEQRRREDKRGIQREREKRVKERTIPKDLKRVSESGKREADGRHDDTAEPSSRCVEEAEVTKKIRGGRGGREQGRVGGACCLEGGRNPRRRAKQEDELTAHQPPWRTVKVLRGPWHPQSDRRAWAMGT